MAGGLLPAPLTATTGCPLPEASAAFSRRVLTGSQDGHCQISRRLLTSEPGHPGSPRRT